ncbi:ROK family transcriptional regulator [Halobacillus ihumii]|uniref:ROK family transcriptional regulator n=1 Tax=Halobacillus ihumii TaxID=2686092 RepID=UPI0013D1374F|nr:ROK family transcriptional regulator [Halobacillus ihumii]
MSTGDARYIKQLNRRILIEEIVKERALSRSDLARSTGLNKATVSAQVNDLIQDHIVSEKSPGELITVGRKPILLEMNDKAGYSIGIDIDQFVIRVNCIDFKGNPFHKLNIDINQNDFNHVVDVIKIHLIPLIEKLNNDYDPIGLTGIGVGIHGIINNDDQVVFTPKQRWTDLNVKETLEKELNTSIFIDNNSNLSAYGEQVYFESIPDLFCITLYSGIGLGIINQNNIYRGYQGFAGEIGHMIIEPDGLRCSCGNQGCWELYASEKTLASKITNHFPEVTSIQDFDHLLKDTTFEKTLDEYLKYLGIGLNNIINIFNPQKVILNGSLINKNPALINKIHDHLHSKMNSYEDIRISHLGENACAIGGAAIVLKNFFDIDTLDYLNYEYSFEDFSDSNEVSLKP